MKIRNPWVAPRQFAYQRAQNSADENLPRRSLLLFLLLAFSTVASAQDFGNAAQQTSAAFSTALEIRAELLRENSQYLALGTPQPPLALDLERAAAGVEQLTTAADTELRAVLRNSAGAGRLTAEIAQAESLETVVTVSASLKESAIADLRRVWAFGVREISVDRPVGFYHRASKSSQNTTVHFMQLFYETSDNYPKTSGPILGVLQSDAVVYWGQPQRRGQGEAEIREASLVHGMDRLLGFVYVDGECPGVLMIDGPAGKVLNTWLYLLVYDLATSTWSTHYVISQAQHVTDLVFDESIGVITYKGIAPGNGAGYWKVDVQVYWARNPAANVSAEQRRISNQGAIEAFLAASANAPVLE